MFPRSHSGVPGVKRIQVKKTSSGDVRTHDASAPTKKKSGKKRNRGHVAAAASASASADLGEAPLIAADSTLANRSFIPMLNYRSIHSGMSLMGAVDRCDENQVSVTLASGVRGSVSVLEVSDQLRRDILASSGSIESGIVPGSVDLSKILPVGTVVACQVLQSKGSDVDDEEEDADNSSGDGDSRERNGSNGSRSKKRTPGHSPAVDDQNDSKDTGGKRTSAQRRAASSRSGLALSMRGSLLNARLINRSSLLPKMTLYACVESIEDRGAIINLGIEGVRCFWRGDAAAECLQPGSPLFVRLPSKLPKDKNAIIQVLLARIKVDEADDGRADGEGAKSNGSGEPGGPTLSLAERRRQALNAAELEDPDQSLTLEQLTPGQLLRGAVQRVVGSSGVVVRFFGVFTGLVNERHISVSAFSDASSARYKVGQDRLFRILSIDYESKEIMLTAKPHLLDLRPPLNTGELQKYSSAPRFQARVIRVIPKAGLYLVLSTPGAAKDEEEEEQDESESSSSSSSSSSFSEKAEKTENNIDRPLNVENGIIVFVPISKIDPDERFEKTVRKRKKTQEERPRLTQPHWALGTEHDCRALWVNWLEGLVSATMLAEEVSQPQAEAKSLVPGSLVEGQLIRITADMLLARFSSSVIGRCARIHFGAKRALQQAAVGDMLSFRVLSHAESSGDKLELSRNTQLLSSSLPPLLDYDVSHVGSAFDGVVTKLAPYGAIVSFYNGVYGLIPQSELTAAGYKNGNDKKVSSDSGASKSLTIGQGLRVYVRGVQVESKRLQLCLSKKRCSEELGASDVTPSSLKTGSEAKSSLVGSVVNAWPVSAAAGGGKKTAKAVAAILASVPLLQRQPAHDQTVVRLDNGNFAYIPLAHFSDHWDHCQSVHERLIGGPGKFRVLLLHSLSASSASVAADAPSPLIFFATAKPSMLRAALDKRLPREPLEFHPGILLPGYVKSVTSSLVFVGFLSSAMGVINRDTTLMSEKTKRIMAKQKSVSSDESNDEEEDEVDFRQFYAVGQSIAVRVLKVNEKRSRVSLIFAEPSDLAADDADERHSATLSPQHGLDSALRLASWFRELATNVAPSTAPALLHPGQLVQATCKEIHPYGTVFELCEGDTTAFPAFAVASHAGSTAAAVSKEHVGKSYSAVVLDVDFKSGVVDISLRRDLVAAVSKTRAVMTPFSSTSSTSSMFEVLLVKEQYLILALKNDAEETKSGGKSLRLAYATTNGTFCTRAASQADSPVNRVSLFKQFQVGTIVYGVPLDSEKAFSGLNENFFGASLKEQEEALQTTDKKSKKKRKVTKSSKPGDDSKNVIDHVVSWRPVIRLKPLAMSVALDGADEAANESDLKLGNVVRCQVRALGQYYAAVRVGAQKEGRIDLTRIVDEPISWPLDTLQVGQWLLAKVVSTTGGSDKRSGDRKSAGNADDIDDNEPAGEVSSTGGGKRRGPMQGTLRLDARPSELSRPGLPPLEPVLRPGTTAVGWIDRVVPESSIIWVTLAPGVRGRVFVLDATTDSVAAARFPEGLQRGQAVRCGVVAFNDDRRTLDLALIDGYPLPSSGGGQALLGDEQVRRWKPRTLKDNAVVLARISRLSAEDGVFVQLAAHEYGRAALVDVPNGEEDGWRSLSVGQFLPCRILGHPEGSSTSILADLHDKERQRHRFDVSLRKEDVASSEKQVVRRREPRSFRIGESVVGHVRRMAPHSGCFVTLSHGLIGRVLISNLSDRFIRQQDLKSLFPAGKLVKARVLQNKADRLELSLKDSEVSSISFADLKIGQIVNGRVKRVESFGVFVRLDNSVLDALCHRSEACREDQSLVDLFVVDKPVKARITRLDEEKKKISVSFRNVADKDRKEKKRKRSDEKRTSKGAEINDDDGYDSDDESSNSSANESEEEEERQSIDEEADDADDDDGDDNESDNYYDESDESGEENALYVTSKSKSKTKSSTGGRLLDSALEWDATSTSTPSGAPAKKRKKQEQQPEDEGDAELVHDDNATELTMPTKKKKQKQKKLESRDEARAEEATTMDKEQALVDELGASTGSLSAVALERRLQATPNDSALWIELLALHAAQNDLRLARQTAERALASIHFREVQERANIWLALLNLEHALGTAESRENVLRQASQRGDARALLLHSASMHERHGRIDDAIDHMERAVTRFPTSSSTWTTFARLLARQDRMPAVHELMKRAVRALGSVQEQSALVSSFAQLEYRHGSVERGRTLLEGLLQDQPKRLDIWNVYLDMEESGRHILKARKLYERLASFSFSSKKMKSIFKRWLKFEKEHGDEGSAAKVRARAKEYVSSKAEKQ